MSINKAYIYLTNKYDVLLGIYEFTNKLYINDNTIKKNYNSIFKVDNNEYEVKEESNIRARLLYSLEQIDGIFIKRDRILSVENNTIYMYIRTDIESFETIENDNKRIDIDKFNDCFTKVDKNSSEYEVTKKIYEKFENLLKKQKNVFKSRSSRPDLTTLFLFILSIISGAIAGVAAGIEKHLKNEWFELSISFACFIISLIMYFVKRHDKKKTDKNNLNSAKNIKTTQDYNENLATQITDHRTTLYNFKDFKVSAFNRRVNGEYDSSEEAYKFMFSDKQNERLFNYADKMNVDLIDYNPRWNQKDRIIYGCILSEKIQSKQILFDSSLCGLDSDLEFYSGKTIKIKKVKYSQYVCNDELVYRNISLGTDPSFYIDGDKLALNPITKGFRDMENSPLTNLIGVNIIVKLKTNEGNYYIANRQCTATDVNNAKLVPSGSGSMDYSDYTKLKNDDAIKNKSFKELLKIAMLRELEEESYMNLEFINHLGNSRFNVLGVSRLFSKSGKPDFFGILEIDCSKKDKEEIITKILDNYNKIQTEKMEKYGSVFKQKIELFKDLDNLENTIMHIIPEDEFLNNISDDIYLKGDSIQLRYTKYLLNYYNKKGLI